MRTCKLCGVEKPPTEYYVSNVLKGVTYYRHECKSCKSKQEQSFQRRRTKEYYEWKKTLKCERCGFDDYRALQFHHHNDDKERNIAEMARGCSLETIKKEAIKCTVLCANCHQIEHHAPVAQ